jgi:hypothetical protein
VSVPDTDRDRVLRTFFIDERLANVPRRGRKRRIVLEHLAGWFEPGRRYTEAEVNARLRVAHPDVAALRRYLVDEALLDRDGDSYWRCGGPVDVDEE